MHNSRDFYLLRLNEIYSDILSFEGIEILNDFFDECSTRELKFLCDFLKVLENIHNKEVMKEE